MLTGPTGWVRGVALFSGQHTAVRYCPAPSGEGVSLRRVDLPGMPAVRAHTGAVLGGPARLPGVPAGFPLRHTALAVGESCAATVEHVLSALAGLGVRDAVVELDGCEAPILDGSSMGFVEALMPRLAPAAGAPALITLGGALTVRDAGGGEITATPRDDDGFSLGYVLDYGAGSPLGRQRAHWDGGAAEFARGIAPARTFSMLHEAQAAQRAGLFGHLSASDMIVVGGDGVPVGQAWRMADEAARHKLLDLIGDMSLLGAWPRADVRAVRSGHALTHEFCRALLANTPGRGGCAF
ncbi:MAG: UDP-3-O-acyl-N-acetylglucosamine deacetylase [Phycisphaeraceae bacterium]|nr:UDP-3-O-acyl-N-acetylglucosamine deacetylase [Phycisphaeraceae bacterium]